MVIDLKFLNRSFVLQKILKYAGDSGEWVVIVCPNAQVCGECSRYIAAALDPKAKFSGRTAILPGGGRVSVSSATEPIFLSDPHQFTASFVGWEGESRADAMVRWQEASQKTFKISA